MNHTKTIDHYNKKIPQYYSFLPHRAVNQLQFNEEAAFSVSTFKMAYDIAKLTKFFMNQMNFMEYDVMDCTACVGGDSFPQSLFAQHVESYEINEETFNLFKQNMTVLNKFGFESALNIQVANTSCVPFVSKPSTLKNPYCAIFDPPWGGPEYKLQEKLRLTLDQQSVESLALKCLHSAEMVLLKLPKNYDKAFLKESFVKFQVHPFNFRNCLFVFILKTPILASKLESFCFQQQVLKEKDLLDEQNAKQFEDCFPPIIQIDEIRQFKGHINYILSRVRRDRLAKILVKTTVSAKQILQICFHFLLVEHFPVSIFIQNPENRAEFVKLVNQQPKFIKMQSEVENQSINVLDFALDSYHLALSDDTEILADLSICNAYNIRFGQSFVKMKNCIEIFTKIMKSGVWYE